MSAKMVANGNPTHARTNQRRTLERAWFRIQFAAIFTDIPQADKSFTLFLLFSFMIWRF